MTAIFPPEGVDGEEVRKLMREDFNVEVAPGQAELKGKIFRIGHLGYVDALDLVGAWAAVEVLFKRLGAKINFGAGVKAMMERL